MGNHEYDETIYLLHPSVPAGEQGLHPSEGMELQLQPLVLVLKLVVLQSFVQVVSCARIVWPLENLHSFHSYGMPLTVSSRGHIDLF